MMGLSPGERSNRLMVLKCFTQGHKVMTSYITAVAATNAISVLSIGVSFILPDGKWYLAFLLQIVLCAVQVGISGSLTGFSLR